LKEAEEEAQAVIPVATKKEEVEEEAPAVADPLVVKKEV